MFLSKHCEEIWAYRLHSSVVMAFTQFISITANICLLKLRALSVFLVAWFRFEGRKSAQDAAPLWSPSFTVGLPLHPSTFRAPLRLSLSLTVQASCCRLIHQGLLLSDICLYLSVTQALVSIPPTWQEMLVCVKDCMSNASGVPYV